METAALLALIPQDAAASSDHSRRSRHGRGQKSQFVREIAAHPRWAGKHQDRPDALEVAGSSPVTIVLVCSILAAGEPRPARRMREASAKCQRTGGRSASVLSARRALAAHEELRLMISLTLCVLRPCRRPIAAIDSPC